MDSLTGVASGDVRFTPESRHKRRVRLMSANDPKRTFIGHIDALLQMPLFGPQKAAIGGLGRMAAACR